MIVGACGFGSTGSSVVTDYLLEYGDLFQVLDDVEFTWVTNPDSLIDLKYHLFNPHNRVLDSIYAISRYLEYSKKEQNNYCYSLSVKKNVIFDSAKKFLDDIIAVSWPWYDFSKRRNRIKSAIHNRLLYNLIPKIERAKKKNVFKYPMEFVHLSIMPDNFMDKAKNHLKEILALIGADLSRNIVLDQPFSGNNPQASMEFFDDPYAIVVDRDPRDLFVFSKTRLIGVNHFMPTDTVEKFISYYKLLRENQPYKVRNDRILLIHFEDLIYNYDFSTKRIRDFLGLGDNPNPKTIFDPSLSINNTQVWKRFPQFDEDIKKIESQLSDYLYDFQKYSDKPNSGEMFFGKSPLHK